MKLVKEIFMDNTTSHKAEKYDSEIEQTLPFYSEFHAQTLDLIRTFKFEAPTWLDTGCGTGSLVAKAVNADGFEGFQFTLCDPAEKMLDIAKKRFECQQQAVSFRICDSQSLPYRDEFSVVTAIQAHHYLQADERLLATEKCFEALRVGGIYVTFENYAPNSEQAKNIALQRWGNYQARSGKTAAEIDAHIKRYGANYFPITIAEHLRLLERCGFHTFEVFWLSYMQAGIYGIK